MKHACLDCGEPMTKTVGDHAYGFDHGKKILLRGITIQRCACGYYEVEIPSMDPLHAAIAEALNVLRVPREKLSFFFTRGSKGVEDGAWGVTLHSGGNGAAP